MGKFIVKKILLLIFWDLNNKCKLKIKVNLIRLVFLLGIPFNCDGLSY